MDISSVSGRDALSWRSARTSQFGQTSVEYLVGGIVLLSLLLVDLRDGTSAAERLANAVRDGFALFAAALSIT